MGVDNFERVNVEAVKDVLDRKGVPYSESPEVKAEYLQQARIVHADLFGGNAAEQQEPVQTEEEVVEMKVEAAIAAVVAPEKEVAPIEAVLPEMTQRQQMLEFNAISAEILEIVLGGAEKRAVKAGVSADATKETILTEPQFIKRTHTALNKGFKQWVKEVNWRAKMKDKVLNSTEKAAQTRISTALKGLLSYFDVGTTEEYYHESAYIDRDKEGVLYFKGLKVDVLNSLNRAGRSAMETRVKLTQENKRQQNATYKAMQEYYGTDKEEIALDLNLFAVQDNDQFKLAIRYDGKEYLIHTLLCGHYLDEDKIPVWELQEVDNEKREALQKTKRKADFELVQDGKVITHKTEISVGHYTDNNGALKISNLFDFVLCSKSFTATPSSTGLNRYIAHCVKNVIEHGSLPTIAR